MDGMTGQTNNNYRLIAREKIGRMHLKFISYRLICFFAAHFGRGGGQAKR